MPRDRWSDDWRAFTASKPIPVEDGIATRKQRGAMADTWWSQRFITMLESFGLGGRMDRGRRYARKGQVMSIDVEPGTLHARVQGSRSEPYDVAISMRSPSAKQWNALTDVMNARVGFAARLLAGELPPELEATFDDVGVALFPASWRDMKAKCSCPDYGNPCKHIAAVLYVFADQLDDDPWLLLAWKGRSREELLQPLLTRSALARGTGTATAADGSALPDDHGLPPWWPLAPGGGEQRLGAAALGDLLTTPAEPADAVLARMDPIDLAVRGERLTTVLRPAYKAIGLLASPPG